MPFLLEFSRAPMTVGAVTPSGSALFGESRQRDVLSAVAAVLPAHGVFTTFAYVHTRWAPPVRRLLRSLHARFDEVVISRTVWANLPPALVYYCRRPHTLLPAEADPAGKVLARS